MPLIKQESRRYNDIRIRLKFISLFFTAAFLLVFQYFASSALKGFLYSFTSNYVYALSAYLVFFSLSYYILSFPLHAYSGFCLERKFNLSRQNFGAWLSDDIRGGLLSFIVFFVFIQAMYAALKQFPNSWWVWIAGFWFLATVFIARITPVLIVPLFFKYSPVDERLKKSIIGLSKKCKVGVLEVYKIDFSRKTNKLNAAVTGMGKTRRVILADNLVNEFTEDEVLGVLAHEFGHHRLFHMWQLLFFGAAATFLSFYILYLVSLEITILMKAQAVYDISIFPAFMLILFIVSFLTMPLQSAFSRKLEKEADAFALKTTRKREAFISLMEKLAERNLADPAPPKLVKIIFYDHPPIAERIRFAENFKFTD